MARKVQNFVPQLRGYILFGTIVLRSEWSRTSIRIQLEQQELSHYYLERNIWRSLGANLLFWVLYTCKCQYTRLVPLCFRHVLLSLGLVQSTGLLILTECSSFSAPTISDCFSIQTISNFDQNQSCECLSLLKVYDGFALGPHEYVCLQTFMVHRIFNIWYSPCHLEGSEWKTTIKLT